MPPNDHDRDSLSRRLDAVERNVGVARPGSTTSRRPDTEPDDGNSRTNAGADTDANVDADAAADADTDSTVDVDGIFRWG